MHRPARLERDPVVELFEPGLLAAQFRPEYAELVRRFPFKEQTVLAILFRRELGIWSKQMRSDHDPAVLPARESQPGIRLVPQQRDAQPAVLQPFYDFFALRQRIARFDRLKADAFHSLSVRAAQLRVPALARISRIFGVVGLRCHR